MTEKPPMDDWPDDELERRRQAVYRRLAVCAACGYAICANQPYIREKGVKRRHAIAADCVGVPK